MSGHNRGRVKARYFYLIALLVVILDQASKHLVLSRVPFGSSVPVLKGVLFITLVENRGGAFGLFQSWAVLLTLLTMGFVIVIAALVRRRAMLPSLVGIGLGLQLGGAVGNLIDRVRFGYVVDFINFRVWPVFNIADAAITAGLLLLAYYLFFCEGRRSDPQQTEG